MQQEIPDTIGLCVGPPPDLFVTEQVDTALDLRLVILREMKTRAGDELLTDVTHEIWCLSGPPSRGQRGKCKEPGQGVRAFAICSLLCSSLFPRSVFAIRLFDLALFPCLFTPADRASDAIRPSQAVPAAACVLLCDRPDAPSRLAWPASTGDPEAQEDGEWY